MHARCARKRQMQQIFNRHWEKCPKCEAVVQNSGIQASNCKLDNVTDGSHKKFGLILHRARRVRCAPVQG